MLKEMLYTTSILVISAIPANALQCGYIDLMADYCISQFNEMKKEDFPVIEPARPLCTYSRDLDVRVSILNADKIKAARTLSEDPNYLTCTNKYLDKERALLKATIDTLSRIRSAEMAIPAAEESWKPGLIKKLKNDYLNLSGQLKQMKDQIPQAARTCDIMLQEGKG